jgi:hypothetical protein
MRQGVAPRNSVMRTFHRVDEHRAKLPASAQAEKRLPFGQSVAVISGLSILCWGVLGLLVVAARSIF